MEDFIQTSDMDNELINEIVCKVKSEGLFDQFRRECLADVDTKPAYQNLQNRVESSVSSFLDEQEWSSQLNKNQLREKLRKLVIEKKFFEAGIERIVDQVVNPKLNANFVPKIEDVAYKLLGIERPSMNMKMQLEIDTDILLPGNYDLEQVSPDSEKSHSNDAKPLSCVLNTNFKNYHMLEYVDTKNDDLESPAFEPIGLPDTNKSEAKILNNDDDMDISDGDDMPQQMNEVKSNISSISGLTSNESNNSSSGNFNETFTKNLLGKNHSPINVTENESQVSINCIAHQKALNTSTLISPSELVIDQDSVLSQVSSESRLSIVTNNMTSSPENEKHNRSQIDTIDDCHGINLHCGANVDCLYSISEETQMQKFNENSSSNDSLPKHLYKANTRESIKKPITQFNIKNEEFKFEGTGRKSFEVDEVLGLSNAEKGFQNKSIDMNETKMKNLNESCKEKCAENLEFPFNIKYTTDTCKHKDKHRENTFVNHPKQRSDLQRSSQKDDHFTHKGKLTSRQRSHSKDSNDGFTYPNKQNSNINVNQSNDQPYSQYSSETTNAEPKDNHGAAVSERLLCTTLASHPVVIDQILTGNELDLKSFIGENRADPIVSSIEKSLSTNAKKPKVAENIHEAKRLMKVRKQIELEFQKKIEQATVKAKQYIRTNVTNIRDESQGIELEFVCRESGNDKNMSGPIVSNPINYVNGKAASTSNVPDRRKSVTNFAETDSFRGFDNIEMDTANMHHRTFLGLVNEHFNKRPSNVMLMNSICDINRTPIDLIQCITEYDKKESVEKASSKLSRKKKIESSVVCDSSKNCPVEESEIFLANVFISDACRNTDNNKILEKQRQKARYSNDDLFKPRPLLGGISRRRRGFNCNE